MTIYQITLTLPRLFSGGEVNITKSEVMFEVQQKWTNPMVHKLELKQKSGLQIKVCIQRGLKYKIILL